MQTPRLAWTMGVFPTRTFPSPQVALFVVAAVAASLVVVALPLHPVPAASGAGAEERAVEGYGNLPISFEPNVGQAPDRYDFVARGQGFGMAINATGATLAIASEDAQDVIRMNLVGASPSAHPRALESLAGKVNYFIGNDPAKWHRDVATFGRVSYSGVFPGIDVTYYGTDPGTLEYDFVVAPGADPGDIRVRFPGARDVALRDGNLVVTTADGAITQPAPVLYQTIAGRKVAVDGAFALDGHEVGFDVGAYDHHRPLVIDPILVYSTYLGGSNEDFGRAIAVDSSGHAFVTGATSSSATIFATPNAYQGSLNSGSAGGTDAFVTKLDATGQTVIYSTYLGGSGGDSGGGIALDSSGAAYVTGYTTSTDFPTAQPFQPQNGGDRDAFVTKLNPVGGALVYSTYLGGPGNAVALGNESGNGIAVDSSGQAYVTGNTTSTNFPVSPGAFQVQSGGESDAFVTELDSAGGRVYSTYLGGSGSDVGFGIALIPGSGVAYVTGSTLSTDLPTEQPFQPQNAGGSDAFVTLVGDTGQYLKSSSYLGGGTSDIARAIAVDGAGRAYVTGSTDSTEFPTTQGSFQEHPAGSSDIFVTKLDYIDGLIYSTYLGGEDVDGVGLGDGGGGIAVNSLGQAYVTGSTFSTHFPTTLPPLQANYAGSLDAFVSKLDAQGAALIYSTYLGGSSRDPAQGIAADPMGAAYVTGYTVSIDFPTTPVPLQGSIAGGSDVFIAKLAEPPPATCDDRPVTIQVTAPNQTTTGTPGDDVIIGTSGIDTIYGSGGNDTICGLGNNDILFGGKGDDKILGNDGRDGIWGEEGSDTLLGNADNDVLFGMDGTDVLHGNADNDVLFGGSVKDTIFGDAGDDAIFGEDGNDTIYGNADNDTIFGEAGDDDLYGNPGTDTIYGGDGLDDLYGGLGADWCDGGAPSSSPGDTGSSCDTAFDIP